MTNKILIAAVVVVIAVGGYFYSSSHKKSVSTDNSNQGQQSGASTQADNPAPQPAPAPVPQSQTAIVETSLGTFEVTLNSQAAPKTVANFVKLSQQGFYNNLTFHRIVQQAGFHLIQGGDPKGDGTGGPGYTIPAEIKLKHTVGAIATARLGDEVNPTKSSSGSQFYIVEEDIPYLDDNYTVFGYVTSGMDIVKKIGSVATDPASQRPLTPVIIKKITIK